VCVGGGTGFLGFNGVPVSSTFEPKEVSLRLADEMEDRLKTDVIDVWFPRCIDADGGFHENFDFDWRAESDPQRSLVFQSRMLWFTSQFAQTRPEFRDHCAHGLRYFRDVLVGDGGTLKNSVRVDGSENSGFRSSYSMAFAIFGLSAAALALDDESAFELAKESFLYLEDHHKDPDGRGYFELTDLRGNLTGSHRRKGQNPHLHLLEALTALHRIWPAALVQERLLGTISFFTEGLLSTAGFLEDHIEGGKVGDGRVNFGHDVEVAHLLIAAADECGADLQPVLSTAKRLTDHALNHGWDRVLGGFWGGRSAVGELSETKIWWVQCEGLLGLTTLYQATGESRYLDALARQWSFVRDYQIDAQFHGLFETVDRKGKPSHRLSKGNPWKAAYHDGRALLDTPQILRSI
jgi:mannobiose 2-epimerase